MTQYGIDLGTTYSAISFINNNGIAEIIKNADDERLTPSVVYFEKEDLVTVGKYAVESVPPDAADRVASADHIKRIMHSTDDKNYFTCFGKKKDPVYLSSMILKKLIGDARNAGHDVRNVVITCPAYFEQTAKQRTKEAGEIALEGVIGANVHIITEPAAAALYYAKRAPTAAGRTILVYDLGGGTFDVTVVSISQDGREVEQKCLTGNPVLGGKDWDQRLIKYYARELGFQNNEPDMKAWNELFVQYCADKLDNNVAKAKFFTLQLAKWAEEDKRALTRRDKIVDRQLILGSLNVSVPLSRQHFDEMTVDLLNQTFALTESVLSTAEKEGILSINTCLLVGGSTFMPQVENGLRARFGDRFKEIRQFEPNEAVALGAAYDKEGIVEVLPRSFGVRCFDKSQNKPYIAILAKRNTPFPVEVKDEDFSVLNSTDGVLISIYESTSMRERLDDIEEHKLLIEEIWHFGRIVTPDERFSYSLKVSNDGILELYGHLSNAPAAYIKFKLQGDIDENAKQQRLAQASRDIVR